MENKEKAKAIEILTQLEEYRMKSEYKPHASNEHCIRVCQAMVARAFGFDDRSQWSTSIYKELTKHSDGNNPYLFKSDRHIFVALFGEILKIAKPHFKEVFLADDEITVIVICDNGAKYKIDVEADSHAVIMYDVMRAMMCK